MDFGQIREISYKVLKSIPPKNIAYVTMNNGEVYKLNDFNKEINDLRLKENEIHKYTNFITREINQKNKIVKFPKSNPSESNNFIGIPTHIQYKGDNMKKPKAIYVKYEPVNYYS